MADGHLQRRRFRPGEVGLGGRHEGDGAAVGRDRAAAGRGRTEGGAFGFEFFFARAGEFVGEALRRVVFRRRQREGSRFGGFRLHVADVHAGRFPRRFAFLDPAVGDRGQARAFVGREAHVAAVGAHRGQRRVAAGDLFERGPRFGPAPPHPGHAADGAVEHDVARRLRRAPGRGRIRPGRRGSPRAARSSRTRPRAPAPLRAAQQGERREHGERDASRTAASRWTCSYPHPPRTPSPCYRPCRAPSRTRVKAPPRA